MVHEGRNLPLHSWHGKDNKAFTTLLRYSLIESMLVRLLCVPGKGFGISGCRGLVIIEPSSKAVS